MRRIRERRLQVMLSPEEIAVSRRDARRVCRRFRDELIEPAAPAGHRGDQESAVLGTHCAGVLRARRLGHEYLTAPFERCLVPGYLQHIAASRPLGADSVGEIRFSVARQPRGRGRPTSGDVFGE
jgi:hypothetical protein